MERFYILNYWLSGFGAGMALVWANVHWETAVAWLAFTFVSMWGGFMGKRAWRLLVERRRRLARYVPPEHANARCSVAPLKGDGDEPA